MSVSLSQPTPWRERLARSDRGPWFSREPAVALVVIGVLYLAVFLLRMLAGSPVDAYSMLYVLPVALAAAAFGRNGGVIASLVAVLLIVAWAVTRDVTLSPSGWASRLVPILLLGYLLGLAVDRVRRAEADRSRMEIAALLHREAIEINDSLIQQMTAARWALEAGQTESSERILADAIADAQRLVSSLIKRSGLGLHVERPEA
jgi:glucose-6-phosphate-specific signal transduction histidine kinase